MKRNLHPARADRELRHHAGDARQVRRIKLEARMGVTATEPERRPNLQSRQVRKAQRFCLDGVASPDMPLAVVGGGHEFCAPGFGVLRRRGSSHYSVEFVARGRGSLALDDHKEFALLAGMVVACGPGVSQRVTAHPRNPIETYFVSLTGPRAPQLLAECGLAPGTAARVSSVAEVQEVFDNLIRDGLRGTGASNTLCAVLAEYLLFKLADLVMPPGAPRPSPAAATYQRCREHITAHFRRLRSLEQVARECDVDQAYLCRLFRRFDREGPYRYLLRLKMNHAAERLRRDSTVLVKEVAIAVGFPDPFHFSHAFKNIFGTAPDVFRRLRGTDDDAKAAPPRGRMTGWD
jgi:AraC-like DNA-binding protein